MFPDVEDNWVSNKYKNKQDCTTYPRLKIDVRKFEFSLLFSGPELALLDPGRSSAYLTLVLGATEATD